MSWLRLGVHDERKKKNQGLVNGRKWTGDKLLQLLRNKQVAHFDPDIPEDLALIRQFKILGVSSQYQAVVPMGIAVLALGQRLLQSLE